ncbi:hypothetical protein ACE6H2_001493 [Prunus campanulata]
MKFLFHLLKLQTAHQLVTILIKMIKKWALMQCRMRERSRTTQPSSVPIPHGSKSRSRASTQLMRGEVGLMEYAATAGLTVVVVIFSIGSISGAHVNPVVTVAFATLRHFPWCRVPVYILAQTMGSVLATYIERLVYGIKPDLMTTRPLQSSASAFWVELIATFMIMFLAASLTHQAHAVGYLSGFVVGIAIGLSVLITGPVSGGSMNPARSLGPAIVAWNFKDLWIYICGPTIGAVAGARLFQILRLQLQPCSPSNNSSPNILLLGQPLAYEAT